jgi:hypothetical protein
MLSFMVVAHADDVGSDQTIEVLVNTIRGETLGIIPFTVGGLSSKPPAEAPASSGTSLAALLAALTGMAWFGLRRRPRQLR